MLTKLRVSSHYLRIETGRYGRYRVNKQDRICHFVIKCPLYDDIRRQFLNRTIIYTRPSMEKFISLLKSNYRNILVKFSKLICFAMIRRNENINR